MAHQSLRLTKILDFVLENGSIQVEDIETLLGVPSHCTSRSGQVGIPTDGYPGSWGSGGQPPIRGPALAVSPGE